MGQRQLEKITSINEVTFQDVLYVLEQWETGTISEDNIFAFAEGLYDSENSGWPNYPKHDKQSILIATLEILGMLYTQPTLKEDIPALKTFLTLGQSLPLEAWKFIDTYWNSIDWNSRLKEYSAMHLPGE